MRNWRVSPVLIRDCAPIGHWSYVFAWLEAFQYLQATPGAQSKTKLTSRACLGEW
jgi:hypothetical protein